MSRTEICKEGEVIPNEGKCDALRIRGETPRQGEFTVQDVDRITCQNIRYGSDCQRRRCSKGLTTRCF